MISRTVIFIDTSASTRGTGAVLRAALADLAAAGYAGPLSPVVFAEGPLPENAPAGARRVSLNNIYLRLGASYGCVVVCQRRFNANHLYAAFGALAGGGALVAITPVPAALAGVFAEQARDQFFRLIAADDAAGGAGLAPPPPPEIPGEPARIVPDPEQREFIAAAAALARGKEPFALHLAGERGAGKTAAAAALAGVLAAEGIRCGVLCAGSREVMRRFPADPRVVPLTLENCRARAGEVDLLIADEAAALPVAALDRVLAAFAKAVLVTTDSGCEGSGRGLANRLYAKYAIRRIELTGRRRAPYDAAAARLDAVFFNAPPDLPPAGVFPGNGTVLPGKAAAFRRGVVLRPDPSPAAGAAPEPSRGRTIPEAVLYAAVLDKRALTGGARGRFLLCALTRLLRENHYEETPQDPIRWLEQPGSFFAAALLALPRDDPAAARALPFPPGPDFPAEDGGERALLLAGAAVATEEGSLGAELARGVMLGTRQPKNNLLPQTLIAQLGAAEAGGYRYLRVERIAVAPAFRRNGAASAMAAALVRLAQERGAAFAGVSFAASRDTAAFWTSLGFLPVNVGLTRDNASGRRSLVMMADAAPRPDGGFGAASACRYFYAKLPHLAGPFGLGEELEILAEISRGAAARPFAPGDGGPGGFARALLSRKSALDQKIGRNFSATPAPIINNKERDGTADALIPDPLAEKYFPAVAESVARGRHSLAHAVYEIKLLCAAAPGARDLPEEEKAALLAFFAAGPRAKDRLRELLGVRGEKAALERLRTIIAKLWTAYNDGNG